MLRMCLLFILFSFPLSNAVAGSNTGLITRNYVNSSDVVLFTSGTHENKLACSTVGDDWSISLATESGKAMYALLLSAVAQGLAVSVNGTDTCTAWADRESPRLVYVNY